MALFNKQMDRRQKTVAAVDQTWVKPTSSRPHQTLQTDQELCGEAFGTFSAGSKQTLDFEKPFKKKKGCWQPDVMRTKTGFPFPSLILARFILHSHIPDKELLQNQWRDFRVSGTRLSSDQHFNVSTSVT